MGEIGKMLQSRREELGLSLDEMEHKTKIRKRYLEAIEVDDWSLLPGHVYARGFVRSYADHLGMDGRALLMEHDANQSPETSSASDEGHLERNQKRGAVTAGHSRTSHTPPPQNRTSSGPRFASQSGSRRGHKAGNSSKGWVGQAVAVVAILAALGAGWWWITQKAHPVKPYTASSNPNHTTTGDSSSLAASGVSSGGNKGSNKDDAHTLQNPTSQPAGQVPNSTVAKPKLVATVTPKPIQGNRLTYVVTSPHPLQVVLSANARLWTTVTADGVSLDGGGGQVLSQGESKPFTAKNSLTFVIGNLPAATFEVDGKTIVLPNVGRTLDVSFVKG